MNKNEVLEITCRISDRSDKGETIQERYFHEIVDMVMVRVTEGIADKELGLEKLHPRALLSIVCTNIIMNLFLNASKSRNNATRKEMLQHLLTDIVNMCIESVETVFGDDTEVKH